jgi:voltage-gated potassium channel
MRKPNYLRFITFFLIGIVIYILLIAELIHLESASPRSNIHHFEEAVWYSIITVATVGYGDFYPVTTGGRAIGLIFVAMSFTLYGLIIGQITTFMATIKENQRLGYTGTDFKNHTVVIGWNQFGKDVVDQLVGVGKKVGIVTNIYNDIDLLRESYSPKLVYILYSDLNNFDLLSKVNLEDASNVFINLTDDTEKLVYILNLKKHFGELKFVVTLENNSLKHTFHTAGTSYIISKNEITSKLLASYIFEPDVAEYSEDIMSYAEADDDHDIKEYKILFSNTYCNRDYIEAFIDLKKSHNSILIGISKNVNGYRKLIKNPPDTVKIEEGDYLIMITTKKEEKNLGQIFKIEEGYIG